MRRFVCLLVFVLCAMPLGLSMAGCSSHGVSTQYCNGDGFGPTSGQIKTITLASALTATGESLNYGQIGAQLSATAADCFNNNVAVTRYTFATTDMTIADINPTTGSVCGGSWNRNTGGGIADYTVCTPPAATNTNHSALITASAGGAVSNAIAVYIHAPVTGVVLGVPSTNCTTDPATNCCPVDTNGSTVTAPPYDVTQCLSQNQSGQLIARAYSGGFTDEAHNITCQVGTINFALQSAGNVATIGPQGVATANQPGSSLVTATVSNSSSALNSGFISTCPPASIVLTAVGANAVSTGSSTSSLIIGLNQPQAFTATVLDTKGLPLNGTALQFNSTLPINFPTGSGTVTALFPGSATITAICQPGSCNPAPFSQIGYLGNGKPITSNGITVTAAGTVSTVLYMGSTSSQYVASEDFTTGQLAAPIKLPYTPNSMVISQDGSTIYMGSAGGMMTIATASNTLSGVFQAIQGSVLAVAPNNTDAVFTDPSRGTVSLVTSTGTVSSSFNGVGTRAQWTPDSSTLYVATTGNQLLTYSTFVGWESTTITDEPSSQPQYSDVAVTVPSVGAYFAGTNTDGRSYCASTTLAANGPPPTATNTFSPLADVQTVTTDRIAATTDGKHILGATVTSTPAKLVDIAVNFPPPTQTTNNPLICTTLAGAAGFNSTFTTKSLTGFTPTAITGIIPSTNSNVAVVTYTGSGGVVPLYVPGTGAIADVALSGGATTAPVAGVFSTDNSIFYAGTSGDNVVHTIGITGTTGTDTGIITPTLPDANGNPATPNLIVQRARRSTS